LFIVIPFFSSATWKINYFVLIFDNIQKFLPTASSCHNFDDFLSWAHPLRSKFAIKVKLQYNAAKAVTMLPNRKNLFGAFSHLGWKTHDVTLSACKPAITISVQWKKILLLKLELNQTIIIILINTVLTFSNICWGLTTQSQQAFTKALTCLLIQRCAIDTTGLWMSNNWKPSGGP